MWDYYRIRSDEELLEQCEKEGRQIPNLIRENIEWQYFVEIFFDKYLYRWQILEGNEYKFIPYIFWTMLKDNSREYFKRRYHKIYNTVRILPPWEYVPIFTELTRFLIEESDYFDAQLEIPFRCLLKKEGWELVGTSSDFTTFDCEMFPVTSELV